MIAPTPFFADRGTHIRILEEALALEKAGNTVTIATYHIGNEINNQFHTKIDVRRIRWWLFWYRKLEAGADWQKIILNIFLVRKAFFLARTQKPDIIHGHLHEGVLIAWIIQKIFFWRKLPVVADFHGSLVNEMKSHGYLKTQTLQKLFMFVEKTVSRRGDFAVVSSPENKAHINSMRKKDDVHIISDGVNRHHFEGGTDKQMLRKRMELPQEKILAVYTGALIANKGIDLLLDVIVHMRYEYPQVHFVLAGFPKEGVEKFVTQQKLQKSVTIVHPLKYKDMPQLCMACDIGLDPKNDTTQQASGKILNYMGAGLSVVCFDRPTNRRYLADGGYYAHKETVEEFSEQIINAVTNKEEREKKGKINKERAQQFSWDQSGKELIKIYKDLCQR